MATRECTIIYSCILMIGLQVRLSMETTTTGIITLNFTGTTTEGSTSTEGTDSTPTATDRTTEQTTTATPTVHCYNGTCSGNVSDETDYSCINDTITNKCELAESESCFQIVFKNSSSIIYDVGCRSNCEYMEEEGEGTDTISTTRCCDTHLCNNKHINDPDPENSAVSVTSSMFVVVCLVALLV